MTQRTAINWAEYPEPWRTIGPHFNRDCRAIVSGHPPISAKPLRRSDHGAALKQFRISIGYAVTDLAEIIDVHPSTVRAWENGQNRIPEAVIAKIKRKWPGAPL